MKKLLLLGGSAQQVIAIKKAKERGYYTILCDYLTDNPGQYIADKFYLVSTTDKDKVFSVAQKEQVNGVLAYASDPAAPTAAYVAEKLGLPTNPYESVNILSEKHLFREYLEKNGFNAPQSRYFSYETTQEEIVNQVKNSALQFPILVKPVDSSGSKGITKIEGVEQLKDAIGYARLFSRNKIIEVEEFLEKDHEYLVGGDIFVVDGKIVFWGLLNCHRDLRVNPLVPVGKSYPLLLSEERVFRIKQELQRLVSSLHIQFGAFNVELIVTEEEKIYFIEVGPRNGGNMIPDLLSYISGKDLIGASIAYAMGETTDNIEFNNKADVYFATHNIHSDKTGLFMSIHFSPALEKYIIRQEIYKRPMEQVEYFNGANQTLGIIFLRFGTLEEMQTCLNNIIDNIIINLR